MNRRVGVAGDENFLTRGGITLGGCANDMTSFGNPNCTGQMALPHLDPVYFDARRFGRAGHREPPDACLLLRECSLRALQLIWREPATGDSALKRVGRVYRT